MQIPIDKCKKWFYTEIMKEIKKSPASPGFVLPWDHQAAGEKTNSRTALNKDGGIVEKVTTITHTYNCNLPHKDCQAPYTSDTSSLQDNLNLLKSYYYNQVTQRNNEILHLREKGLTYTAISKLTGVTRQRIHQICKKLSKKYVREGVRSK